MSQEHESPKSKKKEPKDEPNASPLDQKSLLEILAEIAAEPPPPREITERAKKLGARLPLVRKKRTRRSG